MLYLTVCVNMVNDLLLVAFDISDEDIRQTLPGTLEAFEAGVSANKLVWMHCTHSGLPFLARLMMAGSDKIFFQQICLQFMGIT